MIKNEKMTELGLEVLKKRFGEEKVEQVIEAVKNLRKIYQADHIRAGRR